MIKKGTALKGMVRHSRASLNRVFRGEVKLENSIEVAFIKDLTPRQLGNELLAALLAQHLEVSVPDFALIRVENDVCNEFSCIPTSDGKAHIAFGSYDAKGGTIAQIIEQNHSAMAVVASKLKASSILGRMYGLDTWIANVDRHANNLILTGIGEFYLIDHGHCLTGPEWTPSDLQAHAQFANPLSYWLNPQLDKAEKDIAMADIADLTLAMSQIDVATFVAGAMGKVLYGEADEAAAVRFLTDRIPFVAALNANSLGVV